MNTLPEARRIAHHTDALTYEQALELVKDDEQLVASRSPQAPLRAGWAVIRDATHFSALMSGDITYSLFAGALPAVS